MPLKILLASAFAVASRAARPAVSELDCHSVSPSATDDWCTTNCNFNPPYCPADLCACGGETTDDGGPGPAPAPLVTASRVGGYLMLEAGGHGLEKLAGLAGNATTLPVNTLWLSFVSPDMVYVPGSKTLEGTGLNAADGGDFGFSAVQGHVSTLTAAGVEVFMSMGGWNYNCFPYAYTRYSVGGYGTSTPNFWKVDQYGGGDVNACVEDNQWCYTCEPESEDTDPYASFSVFPEPEGTATWGAATAYVEGKAVSAGATPVWHPELSPGSPWTDPSTGLEVTLPGNGTFKLLGRDPYADFVSLALDLGLSGVDVDYEETWHADYFKAGSSEAGPWTLDQTVYKYAAIMKDVSDNIAAQAPGLKLSTAAAAVGAWSGDWWGGNLKGVWYFTNLWFPEVTEALTGGDRPGGVNVMTYDLSDNSEFHECPDSDDACTLSDQVSFYMGTFADAGIAAAVGYEVGTPAYPDPAHDPENQLPLTTGELAAIVNSTQSKTNAGFFWELYKTADASAQEATPTQVAQSVCAAVLGSQEPRCQGSIPAYP